ncbi:transcriptional regulator [Halalkalibacillus sediminis]|uniref:Transcriptional regulator n=1 Tax=Halalkalibacillus sediminis TaxID=2018042 RepID=A0A2I0QS27_9BACI|nr:BTAD domain-containing putative transcriptional regulator [Halalkalibacillus sediminis]PKR76890.1 transcriptional regulator [Halalkalibacillus sediminis]
MSQDVPILDSQFSPPSVKEQFVQRARLHKKLQQIKSYPVTLIHSGAGYGKSTGLSSYLSQVKEQVCWFSITKYDTDLVPFLTKLIFSVRKHSPSFGARVLQEIEEIDHKIQEHEQWSLMTLMINELSEFGEPVIIVLDDAHHLLSSQVASKWIQLLIEHLVENVHLVLSSRSRPQWKSLSRLKIKGELNEVTQEDLMLSRDEVAHLIQDIHEIDIEEYAIDVIHETTEGWAIACGMLVQQMASGEDMKRLLQQDAASLDDLFQYMVMEVLSKQPLIIQKFLEQTSILEVLSVETCDRILGIHSSKQMLEDLAGQNLFIQKVDENHYRYHALFKVFLENQLYRNDQMEYQRLNREAAYYFEEHSDFEKAVQHHLMILQEGDAARLLALHGKEMLSQGKLERLSEQLEQLSDESKNRYPMLWYYSGEILRYRSKYDQAESAYDRSIDISKKGEDHYVLSMAYEGKARIFLDTIRPDQAEKILQQAIDYREKSDVPDEEKARLYHMQGENLLNSGSAKRAEAWLSQAKNLNLPIDDTNLEARIYLRTGRLDQAKQFLLEKKEKFPSYELDHLPQSHRETDILLSIIASFMGQAEEGKIYAEQGLQQGIDHESPFVEACGWMRMGHAVQLISRYEKDLALKCYDHALDIMEKLNVSRGKAEPYMGLCMLYGMNGEYEKALHAGQKGLRETEQVKDMWLSAVIRLCLAIAAFNCKRHTIANQFLEEARQHFKSCEDDYGLMASSFWAACLGFETGDDRVFAEEIQDFLLRMQTGSYEFFIKQRSYFGPVDMQNIAPLLFKAQSNEIQESYVTRMIQELGFGNLERHPGYTLRIETLGEFNVLIGNEVVSDSDWSRAKSRELLELLVTKRDTAMTKEEIFECLWPDQSEDKAAKNFKVTLNGLLKVLEPKRKAREDSFYIIRSGSTYRLNPQSGFDLDVEDFKAFILAGIDEKDAEKSRDLLKKGLNLYKGNYLTNRESYEWLVHERERLQLLFLRGAEKLAQTSIRLEDYHTSIHWCQEILTYDHTWEEAYRLIMYCYYQQNNRPQAIKWYKKCKEILDKELGIEPMQPTREMYEIITR